MTDDIVSDAGELAPAENNEPATERHEPTPLPERGRDEKGRFASKQDNQPTEPQKAEQPKAEDTPAKEQAKAEDEPHKPAPGNVPQQALDAERRKLREAREKEIQLQQRLDTLERIIGQGGKPQQPQEEAPKPTIWDNEEAYFADKLSPYEKQLAEVREQNSELRAMVFHGRETVEAAKTALEDAVHDGNPEAVRFVQALMQHPDPFAEIVKWHRDQTTRSEIGDDIDAFRKKVIEEYLASQQAASPSQQQQPAAPDTAQMPSSFAGARNGGPRGGQGYGGPRPLSEIMKR